MSSINVYEAVMRLRKLLIDVQTISLPQTECPYIANGGNLCVFLTNIIQRELTGYTTWPKTVGLAVWGQGQDDSDKEKMWNAQVRTYWVSGDEDDRSIHVSKSAGVTLNFDSRETRSDVHQGEKLFKKTHCLMKFSNKQLRFRCRLRPLASLTSVSAFRMENYPNGLPFGEVFFGKTGGEDNVRLALHNRIRAQIDLERANVDDEDEPSQQDTHPTGRVVRSLPTA